MHSPFDQRLRRQAGRRGTAAPAGHDFIHAHVHQELLARIALSGETPPGPGLHIGYPNSRATSAVTEPGFASLPCEALEDQLPFADQSFARITCCMTLHGVNDLPGALLLARRCLKPGGRFAAAVPAGFSLGAVRDAFLEADEATGRGVPPRVGPTVDPAQAAGLLQRAGFTDPVAEVETLTIRYATLQALARDLRANGATGWLATRSRRFTTRTLWAAAEAAFASGAEPDGKVPVAIQILYLAGRVA